MKSLIKKIVKSMGFEIRAISTPAVAADDFANSNPTKWLRDYNIKTILDIGANDGHFANNIRNIFPQAQIYSFEPIQSVYDNLVSKFSNDSKFKAFNFALGNSEETTTIFLNEYSPSSSLLKMKDEHKKHFSFAKKETPTDIQIKKLDSIASDLVLGDALLVKIDVQGFEKYVVEGGKTVVGQADVIIIEVSFKELYENQVMFDEIYLQLKSLGFEYRGNYEQLFSPENGEILQADAIFIRTKNSK